MSIFGRLVSTWDIEQAYIAILNIWLETYLAEVERERRLPVGTTIPRPPAVESIYGGPDFLSYNQTLCPAVIIVVKPQGEPMRQAEGAFQDYEVQVGVVVIDDDEDRSRMMASYFGAAIMGTIAQRGALGGIASSTVLAGAPDATTPDPEKRRIWLCVTTFRTTISPIVEPGAGPATPTPPDSPEYPGSPDAAWGDFPTVQTTDLTVTGEPIEEDDQEDE